MRRLVGDHQIRIDPESKSLVPSPDADELAGLEASLRAEGNRDPIVIWQRHGVLLDGHNRYAICRRLRIKLKPPVEVALPSREHARLWIKEAQLSRRNLTGDQYLILADEVCEQRQRLARREQTRRAGRASGRARRGDPNVEATAVSTFKARTRAEMAKQFKISERKLRYAREVRMKAPALASKVRTRQMTIYEAIREIRVRENRAHLEAISSRRISGIDGRYDVLVIDPPWPVKGRIVLSDQPFHAGELPRYPLMSIEKVQTEVGRMIERHAAEDAHIFLWSTQKLLTAAFKMIEQWRLKYVATFTWHKPAGPQPLDQPCFNSEHVIYARRGAPKFISTKAFATCFDAPRGKHSEKPEYFYEMIRRVTGGARLDLYARRSIDGFVAWGLEAPRDEAA